MKIKEIIVVEGKSDTAAIQRAVNADTIETNGSALNKETIDKIKLAQQTRGVIIFTDPDYPGEKIRKAIIEQVPQCKHAFLTKEEARPKNKQGIGIEHATPQTIQKALMDAHVMKETITEQITRDDLLAAGLIGGAGSKERRERLGKLLKIGYTNGKQLHKRLMVFHISKDMFSEAVMTLRQEEKDE